MSYRLCGQACFFITPILGGRAGGADATDPALWESSALGEAGGLDHGGHSRTLPRAPWSSLQSFLECLE